MKRVPLFIKIPVTLGLIIQVFYFMSNDKAHFNLMDPYLIGVLIISAILVMIIDALDRVIENYRISILPEEEKAEAIKANQKSFFQALYESAFQKQSEKEEQELIIDHGFDGITELDNSLPKWWLGILYITIICAVIYGTFVATTDYADPEVEYTTSIADFEKNYVPPTYEQFIANATLDEGKIPAGKAIFESNCVVCHQKGGAGAAGPNLTDDYWKNQLTDDLYTNIASVVWKGVDGAAMQAWGEDQKLSPEEVEEVAAYVQSLRGTKPPVKSKAREGTLAPWADKSGQQD